MSQGRRNPNPPHGKRITEVIDVDAFYEERNTTITDVDEEYRVKYEHTEEELSSIDAREFRKGVRELKRTREAEPGAVQGSRGGSSASTVTSTVPIASSSKSIPSTVGPAIQEMRRKQHEKQANSSGPPSPKRRKVDSPPFSSRPSTTSTLRSPGISTIRSAATTTPHPTNGFAKAQPARPSLLTRETKSPDLYVVEDARPTARPSMNTKKRRTKSESPLPETTSPVKISAPAAIASSSSTQKGGVICLDSDGEEEVHTTLSRKRQKTHNTVIPARSSTPISIVSTDDDEPFLDDEPPPYYERMPEAEPVPDDISDDDWNPPGLDLNDPDRWKALEINSNKLEDGISDNLQNLILEPTLQGAMTQTERYVHPNTSRWYPARQRSLPDAPCFIWDKACLRRAESLYFRPRQQTTVTNHRKVITRSWEVDFNLLNLRPKQAFKESPGSIGKIEQKNGWIIVGSACNGGGADTEADRPNPYNRPGSILAWRNAAEIPEGHQLPKDDGSIKYYSVNDVKFDPTRELSFVSSGEDRRVRLWTPTVVGHDSSQPKFWHNTDILKTRQYAPHALSFKPGTGVLAVAEKKVHLFELSEEVVQRIAGFNVSEKPRHVVGALEWGVNSTASHLFASSESLSVNPADTRSFSAVHKAFDAEKHTLLYQFDATETGDALAVNPGGSSLALITQASANKYLLRLYDIRRQLSQAITTIVLDSFPTRDLSEEFEGEINDATYSPDGLYLALARNDNHTHVYDVRMVTRGPVFDYEHLGECRAASAKERYGVVKAQWVQSAVTRRIALVTGGDDGCVRRWDPTVAAENLHNGTILGQMPSDVGCFSLGDPFAGEQKLVVGDSSGELTIFDHVI